MPNRLQEIHLAYQMKVGRKVSLEEVRQGATLAMGATRAVVSRQTLSAWRNNPQLPTKDYAHHKIVNALCKFYGVSPSELLGEETNETA